MTLERIGEMVKARTSSLQQRARGELAERGLEDLERLDSDPEMLRQVKILRDSKEWGERIRAWEQIREMGPTIRGWTRALQELIHQADGWARIFAAESLAVHACCEAEAVPVLLVTLESTLETQQFDWSRLACGAIGRYPSLPVPLTEMTVPAMMDALDASDANVQGYAALALGNWGKESRPALAKIADLHDRAGDPLRDHYMEVLRQIDPSIHSSLEARICALDDPDASIRAGAVASLGRMGQDSAEAIDPLLSLTRDEDPSVRRNLALALGDIQAHTEGARHSLNNLSSDEHPDVRLAAAYASVRLGISPQANFSHLISGLHSRHPSERALSAWALGETGREHPWRSRRALKKSLSAESNAEVREAIEKALFRLRAF